MREHHSAAYEDIQPPLFTGKERKPKQPPRIVGKDEARKLFAGIHSVINIENHMEALRQ